MAESRKRAHRTTTQRRWGKNDKVAKDIKLKSRAIISKEEEPSSLEAEPERGPLKKAEEDTEDAEEERKPV